MPEAAYLAGAVLVSALVTWALRALPFAFLRALRRSALLQYIGEALPVGVMTILVLYTVRDVVALDPVRVVAVAAGLAVTAALHLWRGNALLSIGGGTVTHVALLSGLPLL